MKTPSGNFFTSSGVCAALWLPGKGGIRVWALRKLFTDESENRDVFSWVRLRLWWRRWFGRWRRGGDWCGFENRPFFPTHPLNSPRSGLHRLAENFSSKWRSHRSRRRYIWLRHSVSRAISLTRFEHRGRQTHRACWARGRHHLECRKRPESLRWRDRRAGTHRHLNVPYEYKCCDVSWPLPFRWICSIRKRCCTFRHTPKPASEDFRTEPGPRERNRTKLERNLINRGFSASGRQHIF